MSCLHTIKHSPGSGIIDSCASVLNPGDAILFIEDGTYFCAQPDKLPKLLPDIKLYALQEDMLARGTLGNLDGGFELATYEKFVDLCCEFDKVISWF